MKLLNIVNYINWYIKKYGYKTTNLMNYHANLSVLESALRKLQAKWIIKNWEYTPSHFYDCKVQVMINDYDYVETFEVEL